MPPPGNDGRVLLSHADIDGGEPAGFVCATDEGTHPAGIAIRKEVRSDGTVQVWVYFDVLLADRLRSPDGSLCAETRAQQYARLLRYLGKTSGLVLQGPIGSIVNLGALGFTTDERHLPGYSLVKCQLNNVGYYWPPVDPAVLADSIWNGARSAWGNSYWR